MEHFAFGIELGLIAAGAVVTFVVALTIIALLLALASEALGWLFAKDDDFEDGETENEDAHGIQDDSDRGDGTKTRF